MSTTPRKLNEARRLSHELMNSSVMSDESSSDINQSYSIFWKSAFTHTNGRRRREIISNMWMMPMAAHHLAARLIQSVYRGYLLRILLRKDNWWENVERHRQEYLRLAKSSRSVLPDDDPVSFKERLHNFIEIKGEDYVAASLIQSMFRMFRARKRTNWMKFRMYHIAAMEIQYVFRASRRYREEKTRRRYSEDELYAAEVIHDGWKRYCRRSIYMSLRDTVNFRNAGDPKELLKSLSPGDSYLCDGASRIFVRLRLGGRSFPPRIYFKVFTKSAICDVNAFAPRNYADERVRGAEEEEERDNEKVQNRETHVLRVGRKHFHLYSSRSENEMWYRRFENNGWQPLSVLNNSNSSSSTNPSSREKSFRVVKSKHEIEEIRKRKRRDWMKKLYMSGRKNSRSSSGRSVLKDSKINEEKEEEEKQEDLNLLQWAEDLNYDSYLEDWVTLGTTRS